MMQNTVQRIGKPKVVCKATAFTALKLGQKTYTYKHSTRKQGARMGLGVSYRSYKGISFTYGRVDIAIYTCNIFVR